MARIPITGFKGRLPAALSRNLPPGFAEVATNCDLSRGRIEPFSLPNFTTLLNPGASPGSEVKTAYLYESAFWLNWTTLVHARPAPVASDARKRLFWTGDGYPKKADYTTITSNGPAGALPSGSYKLGVKAPTNAPTHGTDVPGTSTTVLDYAYVYTFVTPWGEESAPSPALLVTNIPIDTYITAGKYVQLTGLDTDPGSPYNLTGGTKRIYRTNGGGKVSSINSYLRVAEIAIATTSYNDNISPAALGTPLPSLEISPTGAIVTWDEPPTDGFGLTSMQNGIMAMFSGKTVYFGYPGYPHAWPAGYARNVDYPIVGGGAVGTSLFVVTEGYPFVFFGDHPALMAKEKLVIQQACVSAASVLEIPGGVVYASPDGLIMLYPGGFRNVTEGLFTRDQWQILNPASMHCHWHNNQLYVYYRPTIGAQGGFIFDPFHPENGIVDLSLWFSAGFLSVTSDILYLITGSTVQAWDSHPTEKLIAEWLSAPAVGPPANFAAASAQIDVGGRTSNSELETYLTALAAVETANSASFILNLGALNSFALNAGAELNGSGWQSLPDLPDGAVEIRYFGEAVLRLRRTVNSDEPVRLPSSSLWRRHQIGVRTKIPVELLTMGGSMTEVA